MSRKSNVKRAAQKKQRGKSGACFSTGQSERDAHRSWLKQHEAQDKEWEAGAPEREAENLERLRRDAVLLIVRDGEPLAGVIPSGSDWEFVVRNGFTPQEAPFENFVDAVLELFEELSLIKLRTHVKTIGKTSGALIAQAGELKIVNRGEAGASLLDETRRVLNEEFEKGELEEEVLEVFYKHFADESTREAIEEKWADEEQEQ